MSLSATIKSIQDIMRKDVGVDGDAQRLSQLAWFLFLKIFDAQEDRCRRSAGAAAEGIGNGLGIPTLRWYLLPMNAHDRIVIDPTICHGRPVIRGTRMPVTLVVGSLAGGMTFEEVQREYNLTAEDIRAALKFVGDLAEQESFHLIPT